MTPHQWIRTLELDQTYPVIEGQETLIVKRCSRCGLYSYSTTENSYIILSRSSTGIQISPNLSDDCDIQIISDVNNS